jgi:hypothetical protein
VPSVLIQPRACLKAFLNGQLEPYSLTSTRFVPTPELCDGGIKVFVFTCAGVASTIGALAWAAPKSSGSRAASEHDADNNDDNVANSKRIFEGYINTLTACAGFQGS